MSSKKRKYRTKISESSGGVLDLFDHPAFRSSLPQEALTGGEVPDDEGTEELDEDDLADAPAAEPRPA
jgi:hypothetical protein